MSFESNTGLGVNNHYGPRTTGGTEGIVKTDGSICEFLYDLDGDGLDFGFPVTDGSAYIIEVDLSLTSAGTTFTIDEVSVVGATSTAPVNVASGDGVIATDATDGKILVRYKKYAL